MPQRDHRPTTRRATSLLPSVTLVSLLGACAIDAPPRLRSPATTAPGPSGRELALRLDGLPLRQREALVRAQFALGAMPTFLSRLVPVDVAATIDGVEHRATFWCTPDYFGLGGDDDWLRLPITPQLAQELADSLDAVLPTPRMVDRIWGAATQQLTPHPFHPKDHDILAVALFAAHHAAIEAERTRTPPGALLAGHKKDVVVSTLLRDHPGRVVIYGWHRRDGRPIQPRSKVHTTGHVDYSHGVRFVARRLRVDGAWTTIDAVLADPRLCELLSDEGTLSPPRYQCTNL